MKRHYEDDERFVASIVDVQQRKAGVKFTNNTDNRNGIFMLASDTSALMEKTEKKIPVTLFFNVDPDNVVLI